MILFCKLAILILGVPIEGPWIQGTLVKMMKRVKANIYPPGPKDTDEHDGLEVGEFFNGPDDFLNFFAKQHVKLINFLRKNKFVYWVPTTYLISK